jgi:hypothetical protein
VTDAVPRREGISASFVLSWLLGIVGSLLVAGIIAMLVSMGGVQSRLIDLEVTIRENKAERQRLDADLAGRLTRLEQAVSEMERSRR